MSAGGGLPAAAPGSSSTAASERAARVRGRAGLSIGEVLASLRVDFPDVTISKIRFLESEGLVEPQRTASGYRTFCAADVERLRYVLRAQRENYLPLRVIREHLEAIDRGLEPPPGTGGRPGVPRALVEGAGLPGPESFPRELSDLRLSRDELLEAAGIEPSLLDQIESYGLVAPRPGGVHYDSDALVVARTVAAMSAFGIEPRHLRSFKSAAEREVGLVEQVLSPMLRHRGAEAPARADETAREFAALSVRLHIALVRAGLRPHLGS